MNSDKPTLTMLCGLPGSGKTTHALKMLEEHDNIVHLSSDAIRKELYGDESVQGKPHEVFELMNKRAKEYLRMGVNVIYDACNVNSKKRIAFLQSLNKIDCVKKCVIIATPYEVCLKQNSKRERKVSEEVIKNMYCSWDTPYWFEGWDDIHCYYAEDEYANKNLYTKLVALKKFEQDNKHHSLTLGEHLVRTAYMFSMMEDCDLYYAGLVHDIGKQFVKQFKNSKGEITNEAHYYRHEHVGAYEVLFFDYRVGVNPLNVSMLVNLHMKPYYFMQSDNPEKLCDKYKKLWGEELFDKVMLLHKADKNAH